MDFFLSRIMPDQAQHTCVVLDPSQRFPAIQPVRYNPVVRPPLWSAVVARSLPGSRLLELLSLQTMH